jgi:uncharacterized protein
LTHSTEPSESWLRECLDWVSRDEATHNLMIALMDCALREPDFRRRLYLSTVHRQDEIAAVALRTGDYPKMSISASRHTGAVEELAARAFEHMPHLPCVLGPGQEARRFADAWATKTNVEPVLGLSQRIYQLNRVVAPAPVAGALRQADYPEMELLTKWASGFNEDAHQPNQSREEVETAVRYHLDHGTAFVWEDQEPVSLLTASGPAGRVARISLVYTPPELRRRGYASAIVAAASQLMLDRGHVLCCLYTDRSNPTSNHIYQEVGYTPVCEVEEYWLQGVRRQSLRGEVG